MRPLHPTTAATLEGVGVQPSRWRSQSPSADYQTSAAARYRQQLHEGEGKLLCGCYCIVFRDSICLVATTSTRPCVRRLCMDQKQHVSKINLPAPTSAAAEGLAPNLSVSPLLLRVSTAPAVGNQTPARTARLVSTARRRRPRAPCLSPVGPCATKRFTRKRLGSSYAEGKTKIDVLKLY